MEDIYIEDVSLHETNDSTFSMQCWWLHMWNLKVGGFSLLAHGRSQKHVMADFGTLILKLW